MNLNEHYEQLWLNSLLKFKQGIFKTDPLIDATTDLRRGVTLLIRPNDEVKDNIQKFFSELEKIEPTLYYYPISDIHITIMSIISCYDGFTLKNIDIASYSKVIRSSLPSEIKTQIAFKGITASSSCILLKGFPEDDTLNVFRDNLRSNFKDSALETSIDKRYKINTAHATIIRFNKTPINCNAFLSLLEKYRDFDFGSFEIDSYELVYNDWYQKKELTKTLDVFTI